MAFYTTTSLPRTPSAYTMNATLPSLPSELLSSWSMWRHPKQLAPLTPPMTSTFERRRMQPPVRVTTTLPPIADLDRRLSTMHPLTPPEDIVPSPLPSRLPPIHDYSDDQLFESKPPLFTDAPVVDWLDFTRTRSAHFIAEKTCEMICYLWFSSQSAPSPSRPNTSPPFLHRPNSATTSLQLIATPTFVQFMQKLLETTQVSQSVIVLSLHYIYRLKERNRFTAGQAGSEFRIAVAALMMANKFLDDNTYTNKTWSEVSGIELVEINRMEREFLMGVDFSLYVDKSTYESWLNLLKGLVMAKERDCRRYKSRDVARASRLSHPHSSTGPSSRTYSSKYRTSSHRARSTSPGQTTRSLSYPYSAAVQREAQPRHVSYVSPAITESSSPTPRSGSKRSAAAAFSPTSATFSHIPSKRPVSISLHIPEYGPASGPSSHSPLEGLQSFAKLSLGSSPHAQPPSHRAPASAWVSSARESAPSTLATAYSIDEGRRASVPQNLYFYTLACSPMDSEEETRSRKARLRYHQPPPPSNPTYYPSQPPMPTNIQSASASPHDVHMHVAPHALPHFHDTLWTRQPVPTPAPSYHADIRYQQQQSQEFTESPIPSAPFANAGPPGVQFYPTPVQRTSSAHPHNNWSRGRRL